jgi:hypothetical protein
VGWRRDHTERLTGRVAGHGGDDLQIVHGRWFSGISVSLSADRRV